MFQPLKGIRVLDLSQVLAGPYATYQLALLGAEVLKIEKPGEGDWTRSGGQPENLAKRRMSLAYLTQNGGKRSVTIDLKTDEGRELAKKLAATADVFVENFKPGVAERLGLGYESVRALRPGIVYCSISAYGQNGPMSRRPAYDHVIQGMCGIMMTTGRPGDGPTKVGAPYVDFATGMNATAAVLAGLMERQRTGESVQVDVAMLDTALMLMASLMTQNLSTGWVPGQAGNEAWSASPSSGAFETADGLLMLAANTDAQFRKLCRAIGREDILDSPDWAPPEMRGRNSASLRATLVETFLTRTATQWETVLAAAEVPAARVRRLDETLSEAQIAERGLTSEIRVDGHEGAIHVPTMSFRANGAAIATPAPPPVLGADTEAVLAELGIDGDDFASLREAGIV